MVTQHISVVIEKEGLATLGFDTRICDLGVIQVGVRSFDADTLALLSDSRIVVVACLVIIVLIGLKLLIVVIVEPESSILTLTVVSACLQGEVWPAHIARGGSLHITILIIV